MQFKQILAFQDADLLEFFKTIRPSYFRPNFENTRDSEIIIRGYNFIKVFQSSNYVFPTGERAFTTESFISQYDMIYGVAPYMFSIMSINTYPIDQLKRFCEENYLYEYKVPETLIRSRGMNPFGMYGTVPYLHYNQLQAVYALHCQEEEGLTYLTIEPMELYSDACLTTCPFCFSLDIDFNLNDTRINLRAIQEDYIRQLQNFEPNEGFKYEPTQEEAMSGDYYDFKPLMKIHNNLKGIITD